MGSQRRTRPRGPAAEGENGVSVLLMLCGVQGSGKSTFAKALAEQLDLVMVATDAIRQELTGEYGGFVASQTRQVLRLAKERVRSGLAVPERVVVYDATNATVPARRPFVLLAREQGAAVAAGYFETPLAVALARVRRRRGQARVPWHAVRQTYERFVVPSAAEGFDWVFDASGIDVETCARTLQGLAAGRAAPQD